MFCLYSFIISKPLFIFLYNRICMVFVYMNVFICICLVANLLYFIVAYFLLNSVLRNRRVFVLSECQQNKKRQPFNPLSWRTEKNRSQEPSQQSMVLSIRQYFCMHATQIIINVHSHLPTHTQTI